MFTIEEALTSILSHCRTGALEQVALPESLWRICGTDLRTPHDSPPFDKSMMDGFAISSEAFRGVSARQFSITETITAGTIPFVPLTEKSAARIMTGAPIPAGADCVVPIERVDAFSESEGTVTISSDAVSPGANILRQGTNAKTGDPLLSAGVCIEPQHIAVLAEFGIDSLPVVRRPEVGVLATGDELVEYYEELKPGFIRNSNEPMLVSQIQRAHAIPRPLGIARDTSSDLKQHIRKGLRLDVLLLSGGVSAGTLDLVPAELQAAGVEQIFHKVQLKPGKPLWFGKLATDDHQCLVFGLPGNPVSSMICFELFVRPAIRKLSGIAEPQNPVARARLTQDLQIRGDRVTCYPAKISIVDGCYSAAPVAWGGSADLRSTAEANGMLILRPQTTAYKAGAWVDCTVW